LLYQNKIKLITTILIALLSILSSGCGTGLQKVRLDKAERQYASGNCKQTYKDIETAKSYADTNTSAKGRINKLTDCYLKVAEKYYLNGNCGAAHQYIDKAISFDKTNSSTRTRIDKIKTGCSQIATNCKALISGLPSVDPLFNLKGSVTLKNGHVYNIQQFGKKDRYHEYYIEALNCKKTFPFFTVQQIELDNSGHFYKVTLKNGKKVRTKHLRSFFFKHSDSNRHYKALTGGADKQAFLWLVVNDPRYKTPREAKILPYNIKSLSIE